MRQARHVARMGKLRIVQNILAWKTTMEEAEPETKAYLEG
jgi:hypothetical protein